MTVQNRNIFMKQIQKLVQLTVNTEIMQRLIKFINIVVKSAIIIEKFSHNH